MAMNPFEERGIPLERQIRTWSQVALPPYRKQDVDAFTRCRIILMNGIENEASVFSHAFARVSDDPELKAALAALRRVEHQQQNTINGHQRAESRRPECAGDHHRLRAD